MNSAGVLYCIIINLLCREVRFSLRLGGTETGNPLNSFDEGVEFSFRNFNSSSREWIPLMFFSSMNPDDQNDAIRVGEVNTSSGRVQIRGYNVLYNSTLTNDASTPLEANLNICGREIVQSSGVFNHIQFRWLQTVTQSRDPNRDRVLLDNVVINSYTTRKYGIFVDDFDNQIMLK